MTKRQPRYTDNFRADAVLMLEAAGYPDREGALMSVARKLDVPHPTLHRWVQLKRNPPPSELVRDKKTDLLTGLTELLNLHIREAAVTVETAEHNHIMTGLGILFDKIQLLQDKPTGILKLQRAVETGQVSYDQVKERYPSLAAELFPNVIEGEIGD